MSLPSYPYILHTIFLAVFDTPSEPQWKNKDRRGICTMNGNGSIHKTHTHKKKQKHLKLKQNVLNIIHTFAFTPRLPLRSLQCLNDKWKTYFCAFRYWIIFILCFPLSPSLFPSVSLALSLSLCLSHHFSRYLSSSHIFSLVFWRFFGWLWILLTRNLFKSYKFSHEWSEIYAVEIENPFTPV